MTDELRSRVLALPARDREELAYALLESLYADTSPNPVRLISAERGLPDPLRDGALLDGALRDSALLDSAMCDGQDRTNVVDLNAARARLLPS